MAISERLHTVDHMMEVFPLELFRDSKSRSLRNMEDPL